MSPWRGVGMRMVAALLSALLLGDLTDAGCDPVVGPGPRSAAMSTASGAAEGGAPSVCVEDCFCCARSEAPASEAPSPALAPTADALVAARVFVEPVVHPVPERPPLARS